MIEYYIIKNRITTDIFLLENIVEALKVATDENKKDENHPSFYLYIANKYGKCELLAELVRNFGNSELYWKYYV